jgi:uncharacterized phage protein (TIGR02218 family)
VSKTIDAGLLSTYQGGTPTVVPCVTITRKDGHISRWVGCDKNVTISGNVYLSAPGVQLSSIASTEGFGVDNLEITILEDSDITRDDLMAGLWDGATMEIAEVDWTASSPVKNILKIGTWGNAVPKRGFFTVEFRDLRQPIQGAHETVMQPTCRYFLGDSKCTMNVSAAPFTRSGTITSTSAPNIVTDTARTEVNDYFGEGMFKFTTGANAGLSQKVKAFALGQFTFWQAFIQPIVAGDNYTVTAGCRLRFQEDCITKFANGINFGGEPNKLSPDVLTAPA